MIVRPFPSLYYEGKLEDFVSPPLDMISPEKKRELMKRETNVIRLLSRNYRDGKELLRKWEEAKIIASEKTPIFIVLEQQFHQKRTRKSRVGVIGLVDINERASRPIPHEGTLKEYVNERKAIFNYTEAQVEPIFVLSSERELEPLLRELVNGRSPDSFFTEPSNVINNIYFIRERRSIRMISSILQKSKGYIADGHHRVQALLELNTERKLMKMAPVPCLTYITPIESESTSILGYHRILRSLPADDFKKTISEHFSLSYRDNESSSGYVRLFNGEFATLIPKSSCNLEMAKLGIVNPISTDYSDSLIIDRILGSSPDCRKRGIEYTPDEGEAIARVQSRDANLAILIPDWKIDEFRKMVERGKVLRPKSTFFFPKIPAGIAIYKMSPTGQ